MENSPESSSHRPVVAVKLEDWKGTGSTWRMERGYFQGQGGAGPMLQLPDLPPLCTVTRETSLLADT